MALSIYIYHSVSTYKWNCTSKYCCWTQTCDIIICSCWFARIGYIWSWLTTSIFFNSIAKPKDLVDFKTHPLLFVGSMLRHDICHPQVAAADGSRLLVLSSIWRLCCRVKTCANDRECIQSRSMGRVKPTQLARQTFWSWISATFLFNSSFLSAAIRAAIQCVFTLKKLRCVLCSFW